MEQDLELFSPILEILEIGVCNIIYNPGNIGKSIFSLSPILEIVDCTIQYFSPILEIVDRTIQYLLIILKIFFEGGPGGRRAVGVGVRSTISRLGLSRDRTIQYFHDMTELKKIVFQYFQDSGECCRPQFPIFPGLE